MPVGQELDPGAFSPLYHQLAQLLHTQIRKGELKPGDRIPTENELSDLYSVSRVTVRRAIALLTETGLLEAKQGRGTFVVNPDLEGGLLVIPDLHKELRSQGLSSGTRLLNVEVISATPLLVDKLGVKRGSRLLYLERLLESEGEPLVLDRKYLLSDKSQPLLEAELGHGSIADLFAGNESMVPVRNDLTLSVTCLDAKEAQLLRVKRGAPAFSLEHLMIAANDVRVGWGTMLYRGDKFQFKSLSRML